ncbi:MAG: OmpH family outer membrane protein [Bacteroidetes bacterium]|nr:OmpH family outer membrane protein [Bacteroidota bacterium]
MKNLFKVSVFLILACISTSVFSQAKIKLGHVDSNELLKMMPGRDSAMQKMQDYQKSLENQLKAMQNELETKYTDFTANQATMSELIKQTKQKELQDLNGRIEAFQTSAQQDLQNKEQEVLKPIVDKAKKAIEDVAKENGYTYIFDAGVGVLLYNDGSENILPLVKKKIGIK